jgi:chromosome segregation ATPase
MDSECVTKEMCKEKHENSGREFDSIKEQLKEHEEKLREADIRFTELSGDVKHIKDRIDNGLSTTICQIKEKMDEFMPLVRESSEWAGRFKQAVYFVAVISFGGGLVSLAFHFAAMIAEKVFG